MEQGFIYILKQMVKEQGIAALTDTKKCRAFLTDYTRNEYKKESRLILQSVEAGVPKIIASVDNLAACKKGKIKDLEEEYALSTAFAADIVDTLALVLRGDTTKTVIETLTIGTTTATPKPSSSTPVKEKKTFGSGNVYEGETLNGVPHGKGKKTFADGSHYEGDFVNGTPTGKGKATYPDGTVYEGNFVNGAIHDKGKMTHQNGNSYEGDFVNGNFHGKGKLIYYADGIIDEGDFKNGYLNGKGKKTFPNGGVYEGDFVDGTFNGIGKLTNEGVIVEGGWSNGQPSGKVKVTMPDGTVEEKIF